MDEQNPLAKLDSVYHEYVRIGSWQQAAQNRSFAAGVANNCGRRDLFRSLIQQAIEIAQDHLLRRFELQFRLFRFRILLTQDITGQALDELRQEVDFNYVDGLTGELANLIKRYGTEAQASYDRLIQSLADPDSSLEAALEAAKQQAAAFGLGYLSGRFDDLLTQTCGRVPGSPWAEELRDTAEKARGETSKICTAIGIDLLILFASLQLKLNAAETAADILMEAEKISESLPEKRCAVYMAWADFLDQQGKLEGAIDKARQAVETSQQVPVAVVKAQAKSKLEALLVRRQPDATAVLATTVSPSDFVTVRLTAAHDHLVEGRFAEALFQLSEALTRATRPELRRMVVRERSVVFYELGQFADAEADIDETLALLKAELESDTDAATGTQDGRLLEEEDLYLLKAWLLAKRGQDGEAWDQAERGRAISLKRRLPAALFAGPGAVADVSFDRLRPWLAQERAAIVCFAVTRWGTLALSAGPDDLTPKADLLVDFAYRDLRRLLEPALL